MSFWECANEAPKVYQFVGNTPEQVMREAADFLEQARDRGEYLTQWNIAMDEADEDRNEVWYGTLTTNGAGFVAPWETPESDPLLQEWERELLAAAPAAAEVKLAAVKAALAIHPRVCASSAVPVTCGWKRAVQDVERALADG